MAFPARTDLGVLRKLILYFSTHLLQWFLLLYVQYTFTGCMCRLGGPQNNGWCPHRPQSSTSIFKSCSHFWGVRKPHWFQYNLIPSNCVLTKMPSLNKYLTQMKWVVESKYWSWKFWLSALCFWITLDVVKSGIAYIFSTKAIWTSISIDQSLIYRLSNFIFCSGLNIWRMARRVPVRICVMPSPHTITEQGDVLMSQ